MKETTNIQEAGLPAREQQESDRGKRPTATQKILLIALLAVILLLTILAYVFIEPFRLTQQRRTALEAYERGDYATAERLLLDYVQKFPNSESEYVVLANIYHKFGNMGQEAQIWNKVSILNPSKKEYQENMLDCALQAADYLLLHGILARKAKTNNTFSDQELYLFVISSFRSGYPKDGEDTYKEYSDRDPEAFHKNDLGLMAEFLATSPGMTDSECDAFLYRARQSENPVVRYEALYSSLQRTLARPEGNAADDTEIERLLKEIAETNPYAGTPLLAEFYFSRCRFEDMAAIAEPYLHMIDNRELYLMYAESCVYANMPDKLKPLEKKLRGKPGSLSPLADYCAILTAYMENDDAKLDTSMRNFGKLISSPLSQHIRLRLALGRGSFNEILAVADDIFSNPPFHDLHDQAMILLMNYLAEQMKKPENQNDPTKMAELAKIMNRHILDNQLILDIIFSERHRKGIAKESDLLGALEIFPDDLLLLEITAEQMLFYGKAEQVIELITQAAEIGATSKKLEYVRMQALEQMEKHDEAEVIFRNLVEQSGFDPGLLFQYFTFCRDHDRDDDLAAMAKKLETVKAASPENEQKSAERFAPFFRAAALISKGDDAKKKEAMDILAATPSDDPDFTFYAANELLAAERMNDAEAKYLAILKTYSRPAMIYVNLSEIYDARGEREKALEAAKNAFEAERTFMQSAFVYAKHLSADGRYGEAVEALRFPRHEVDYPDEIVELWADCMHHVIEKSIEDRKFLQAEAQCKHLLIIAPNDTFGKENLEKVQEIMLEGRFFGRN